MNTPEPIRAPRLTDKLLRDDLPELVKVADDELAYVASRLAESDSFPLSPLLAETYRRRRECLTRARDWLAGKIAAETTHRTED